jgi:molybdopterin-containing oxidoreductase family iron-sulfur binding subunit
VRAPVWVLPGQAEDTITVSLGYGRIRAGRVGTGLGFDAYGLRTSDALWSGSDLEVRKTGGRYPLAPTQLHHNIFGRELLRAGTFHQFERNPNFAAEMSHAQRTTTFSVPGVRVPGLLRGAWLST